MEKEVVITQTLDAKDLTNGSIYSLLYSSSIYIFSIIYSIVLINALITLANPFGINRDDSDSYSGLIIITLIPLALFFMIKRQAAAALKKKGRYYNNISYSITSSFIKCEGEGYSNTYKWEEIVKVKEIKKWYLIYINKHQALIINKKRIDNWQKESLNDMFLSVNSKTKVSLK